MSLGRRSVTSVAWNSAAGAISAAILLVRSIILARLLPVDTFGIYAFASSIVALTVILPNFGMGGAFLHRSPETENEKEAASVHFTLKLIFTAIWAVVMIIIAELFTTGDTRAALIIITLMSAVIQMTQTARLVLIRRIVHRRMALIQLTTTVVATTIALLLALRGETIVALLSTDVVAMLVTVTLIYVYRPVWRPRLAWSSPQVRYFINFGSRTFLGGTLQQALDRIDDLWTGFFLGQTALGYYSRAYRFATYPRILLASPINKVATGTYSEVANDKKKLSKAFFRANALLVRSGFFLAGILALIAPEFIRIFLGLKWLPMLDAFRLMIVFTMLDPIKTTIAAVFIAVGHPGIVVRSRMLQLIVMVILLFTLGNNYGFTGVAVAVDVMVVTGIGLLLYQSKSFVDFSVIKLFAVPALGLSVGLLLTAALVRLVSIDSDWIRAATKVTMYVVIYGVILFVAERSEIDKYLTRPARELISNRLKERN